MVATETMATLATSESDFTVLPQMPADVFTAPLKRPAHVGEDWLEPAQTDYSSDQHAIWDDLFARQMQVLPGRAASLFMQAVGRRYVAHHNRRHGRQGGLWSGRYRGTVLDPARYLLDAMVFTETREGGGADWAPSGANGSDWSSAPHHLGLRTDPLVTDAPGFWALGNTPFERQAAWRARLQEGLGESRRRELAEDVVQDAYFRLQSAPTITSSFKAQLSYLFQIVRNLAIDHYRKQALELKYSGTEEEGLNVVIHGASPETSHINFKTLENIADALT